MWGVCVCIYIWNIYIYSGTLLGHKKEQSYAIYRDMDGPRDSHTE